MKAKQIEILKVGQQIKAKWDGAISEIVEIKDGIVAYKCYAYEKKHLNDGFNDSLFRSKEEEIHEQFILL